MKKPKLFDRLLLGSLIFKGKKLQAERDFIRVSLQLRRRILLREKKKTFFFRKMF